MDQEDKNDVAGRCLAGLRAQGIPATRVLLDPTKLKGGYICDTMRVKIFYDTVRKMSPKATGKGARGWGSERPATAILKIASPVSNDHDVAMKLRLYEREWHFYETLSSRVPVRATIPPPCLRPPPRTLDADTHPPLRPRPSVRSKRRFSCMVQRHVQR